MANEGSKPTHIYNPSLTLKGSRFRCSPNIAHHLDKVFAGEYDVPLVYSGNPPTILDLGANYGSFSIWASHRWPGCTIHAFEPHPETFLVLKENILCYPNVKAHPYAVGEAGIRVLLHGPGNSGENSLHLQASQVDFTGEHVEVTDPLSLPPAQILKMDIEGCEFEVLEPLLKDGRRYDAVMLEYHNDNLRRRCWDLLGDYKLTGAHCYNQDLGVLRFVHRDLI